MWPGCGRKSNPPFKKSAYAPDSSKNVVPFVCVWVCVVCVHVCANVFYSDEVHYIGGFFPQQPVCTSVGDSVRSINWNVQARYNNVGLGVTINCILSGEDPGWLHWLHLQPPFSSFFFFFAGVACTCHKNPSSTVRLCFDSIPQASHCAVDWGFTFYVLIH